MTLPRALRPFRSSDYRILAFSMVASLFGAGMWAVALVYEVMALGGTELDLSLVGTATSLGILVSAVVGGAVADRFPKRIILRGVEGINVVAMGAAAVLGALGIIEVWHLAVSGALLGIGMGFFYPAYSAILPRILPADELLAANGIEGMGRPMLQQAAGPAVAGVIVAAISPGTAIMGIAVCHAIAFVVLLFLGKHVDSSASMGVDAQADLSEPEPEAVESLWRGIVGGVVFTLKTKWLLWTLLWASILVFIFIGPFEVLTAFTLRDRLGLGSESLGALLAIFGIGGAIGSYVVASMPLPRRYFTWMFALWGFGLMPIALFGLAEHFWLFAVAAFVIGVTTGAANVIWGTLLQRRVPVNMLGRVSSLDFFVSISLMPISMAIAGPLAQIVPADVIFVAIGIIVLPITIIPWWLGGFARDEVEHPLDAPASETQEAELSSQEPTRPAAASPDQP